MIKLNLGCGDRKLHDFVNVDARDDLNPDVVWDVTRIHEKFYDVDLIYACHVLEHFPNKLSEHQQRTWKQALESWYSVLRNGGILRIAVPDMKAACEYYLLTNNFESVRGFFYGGQRNSFDFHYHGWSFDTLEKALLEVGFKEVHRYDWRKTEHFYVDDYSQTYLPHMDKTNGKLMSLNIEAIK